MATTPRTQLGYSEIYSGSAWIVVTTEIVQSHCCIKLDATSFDVHVLLASPGGDRVESNCAAGSIMCSAHALRLCCVPALFFFCLIGTSTCASSIQLLLQQTHSR